MELERLAWASLWGTALALVVAGLCRLFPKLPASVRFWLWWAVPAKLLLSLVPALTLAVLPASRSALAPSQPVSIHSPNVPARSQPTAALTSRAPKVSPWVPTASQAVPALKQSVAVISLRALVLVWLLGAAGTLIAAILPMLRLSLFLRRAGGRGPGGWREVPGVGPLVFGLVRPVIILPVGLTDAERRLALAHEQAHLTRRDPWLALVPLAARALFWFLPTVYLVERALATAREEACDALARQTTGATAREYGALLLKLTRPTQEDSGALAMASPIFSQLQSRLHALALPQRRVALWPLLLPGALVLPGWRLIERALTPHNTPLLPTGYTRRNLPTLGGLYSDAFAITDAGVIVGAANGPDGLGHATLWQDGTVQALSRERSLAFAASTSGGVAIATLKPGKRSQARWLQGKTAQALPGLLDFPETVAVGITEAGVLVGSAQQQGRSGTRAVVWEAGQVRELGTLGGPFSQASAVSRNGWIVGKADISPTETHAFVYDGTRLRDLGTLGGRNSRALAVNAAGQVVGVSETASGERQAFLWSAQTGMHALPGTDGIALALADDGTCAGQADGHAALWRPDGTRVPLDPSLVVVRGIGPHGELVGQGWAGDDLRGFCLTPSRKPIR